MNFFNIIILRLVGIILMCMGIINTIQIENEFYLSKLLIGVVFILLSFEKEDKQKPSHNRASKKK